jgi:hypothetical protein
MKLDFELVEQGPDFLVRLNSPGTSAEERFLIELLSSDQASKAFDAIEDNVGTYGDISYAGGVLWRGFNWGKVREAYDGLRASKPDDLVHIRLSVPAALRELPWEALYDEDIGPLAGDRNYSISRQPPKRASIPPFGGPKTEALSMLCIIPSGSGLNTEQELNNIQRAGAKLDPPLKVESMLEFVEPDQLRGALTKRAWDIVHYVGHGRVDAEQGKEDREKQIRVRFHSQEGGELWMDAEIFAQQFAGTGVRLVVLNCCSSDMPSPTRYLSGLGPYLMRKGIPAVVAMRYEIADIVAIRFSQSFYHNLFAGETPGRIDFAVESARAALLRNKQPGIERGFITPVLYLADGYEQLFNLESRPQPSVHLPLRISTSGAFELPSSLRTAFEEGQCVPVIGPSILGMGASRRAPPLGIMAVAGPRELAETLQKQCPYDRFDEDLKIGDRAGEWMNGWLLHWVCQHYQHYKGTQNRGNLLKNVIQTFKGLEPNDAIRSIVKWNVPGLFYTYFDGLMEQCINEAGAHLNSIVANLTEPPVGDSKSIVNQRPLVLLRGSLTDPDSLVLTEEDHEALIDNLGRMHPTLAAIAKQIGRSVLFLGVSPRDPVVRALSQELLETGSKRKQGPTFFVWPGRSVVDEAYWRRYAVEWVDRSAEEVIEALNSL